MEKLLGVLPPRVIAALGVAALLLIGGMLIFAVLDNRTVELFPPKIHEKLKGAGGSIDSEQLKDFAGRLLGAVDAPMLMYEQDDATIRVIAANQAAADFYVARPEDLIGQTPVRLHEMIEPRIVNYSAWATEQMGRISRASRPCSSIGTTRIPMQLAAGHPTYTGLWKLTSGCFEAAGKRWVVTRFHQVGEK